MSVAGVSSTLWRERELLELLLFKLEEEQLLLTCGRTRWLARATKEVEVVLEEVRRTELMRAVQVDAAAAEVGLRAGPSLRELAEACSEPWRSLLLEHRHALMSTAAEIQQLAEVNRDLLTSGLLAAREALLSMTDSAEAYAQTGSPVVVGRFARLVDAASRCEPQPTSR